MFQEAASPLSTHDNTAECAVTSETANDSGAGQALNVVKEIFVDQIVFSSP